jgi:hypothetical protein
MLPMQETLKPFGTYSSPGKPLAKTMTRFVRCIDGC